MPFGSIHQHVIFVQSHLITCYVFLRSGHPERRICSVPAKTGRFLQLYAVKGNLNHIFLLQTLSGFCCQNSRSLGPLPGFFPLKGDSADAALQCGSILQERYSA